jgi:hypothetical protein
MMWRPGRRQPFWARVGVRYPPILIATPSRRARHRSPPGRAAARARAAPRRCREAVLVAQGDAAAEMRAGAAHAPLRVSSIGQPAQGARLRFRRAQAPGISETLLMRLAATLDLAERERCCHAGGGGAPARARGHGARRPAAPARAVEGVGQSFGNAQTFGEVDLPVSRASMGLTRSNPVTLPDLSPSSAPRQCPKSSRSRCAQAAPATRDGERRARRGRWWCAANSPDRRRSRRS